MLAGAAYPTLSATAFGTIKFGDSLSQIEKQLGEKTQPAADIDEESCRFVDFTAFPHVEFMVQKGIITRANSRAPIPTSIGVTVGASLQQVKDSASSMSIEPHFYDSEGHYLIFKTPNGKNAVIMEEVGGKVTAVRGGLEPSVQYVEGCQ